VWSIDRDGHVVSHTALAPEGEPFLSVTATATDFIAATAHAVSVIGPDGAIRASVTTDERIGELAAAGPRALAVIGRRTRRLALEPLAWGDWTPAAMTSIALSPDGTRAAGIAGAQAIAVDLATGKRVATRPATADAKLAFTDDDHVAIAGAGGRLAWLRLRAGEVAAPAASLAVVAPGSTPIAPALAIGGGRAFAAYGSDLAIATPVAAHYLGYRITGTWNTSAAPGGAVVGDGKDWAFLDAQLALVGRPHVWAPPGHEIIELATTPSRPHYPTASVCAKLAARRELPIEVPGNAVFKSLVRAIASTSGANILDWGTFPIAGVPRRAATIVRETPDHQVIGYLIEVAPGSVVEVIVATDGFRTHPDYTFASATEPGWVTRVAAAAAQRTDGTPHTDDGFEFESTLPRFGEDFSFTLRDDGTPVLRNFSWYEMGARDGRTGLRDHTGDRKTYVKAGSCARCPVLANWKPHSATLAVRGPSRDPEALRLDDPKFKAP
jgi:hypothetical protein